MANYTSSVEVPRKSVVQAHSKVGAAQASALLHFLG